MKKLDWYIIKKFLGTYFFTIVLILAIAIVLDYNQKMEKFSSHEAPAWEICKYYLNFNILNFFFLLFLHLILY